MPMLNSEERARVLTMLEYGRTQEQVSISRLTIRRHVRRIRVTGTFADRPRSGRHHCDRSLTPESTLRLVVDNRGKFNMTSFKAETYKYINVFIILCSKHESNLTPGDVRWYFLALVKTVEKPVWYARIPWTSVATTSTLASKRPVNDDSAAPGEGKNPSLYAIQFVRFHETSPWWCRK